MRLIALINGSTRLGVITWLAGGDYPPGQYGKPGFSCVEGMS